MIEGWMIETARRLIVVLVGSTVLSGLAFAAVSGIGVEIPLLLVIVTGFAAALYLIEPAQEADAAQSMKTLLIV